MIVVAANLVPTRSLVVTEENIVRDGDRLLHVRGLLPDGGNVGLRRIDIRDNRLYRYKSLADVVDTADDRSATLPTIALARRFLRKASLSGARLASRHYEK